MRVREGLKYSICISPRDVFTSGDIIPQKIIARYPDEIAHYLQKGDLENPYEEMSREELKELAQVLGIRFYKNITNEKLIELIRGQDAD